LAALIAGVVIHFTGWMQIDPILSLFVCVLLLRSTTDVLKESYHFLMEGVPHHINYVQVGKDLQAIDGVLAVHDLHVWEMSPGHPALIGHVEIRDLQDWPITMEKINKMLLEKHEIDHVTLQPEMPS
jgi:cobalt-zinc-cadmium efflux system protein